MRNGVDRKPPTESRVGTNLDTQAEISAFEESNPPQTATSGTVTERPLVVIIRGMKRKLSPKVIEHLKATGPKRMDVWDTVLQCFGVRVSPGGRKTWFVIVRVDGRQKRVSIGTYPAITLAEARAQAHRIIRDAQLGIFDDDQQTDPPPTEVVRLEVWLFA